MSSLSMEVAVHRLVIKPQAKRKSSPPIEIEIISKIKELKKTKVIQEVQYWEWIANIVPLKKNG